MADLFWASMRDFIYDCSTAIHLEISLDFQVCTVGVSRNTNPPTLIGVLDT